MNKGKFITLEGGEGVGKSTNIAYIKHYLEKHHFQVITTREPGGTKMAEGIRELILQKQDEIISEKTELLLMFAARAQHITNVIIPALEQGKWVISDRFTDATYAYQGGGREMDTQLIALLENLVQGDLRPNLTLLLDAPIEIGLQRATERGELDRFESEQLDFYQRVRSLYLQRAEKFSQRISVIDAGQPLPMVKKQIDSALDCLLKTSHVTS